MRIAIISDTHRNTKSIDKVLARLKDIDRIIHLGDNTEDAGYIASKSLIPLLYVRGNCDFNRNIPIELFEELGGKKVLITHGHRYHVKEDLMDLLFRGEEIGAHIVLYGHTHIAQIDYERGIWFVNPGSTYLSRTGSNSFAILTIEDSAVNVDLVQL